jgi:hypothetical protein
MRAEISIRSFLIAIELQFLASAQHGFLKTELITLCFIIYCSPELRRSSKARPAPETRNIQASSPKTLLQNQN